MSDRAAEPTRTDRRGCAIRWVLPLLGSVALMLGGLWAVEVSRSGSGPSPAVNPASVSLYALMIVLYALVSFLVGFGWQAASSSSERVKRAAFEAVVVGFAGAPAILFVLVLRALYVGDLGR